jgi:hypothetical protein
MTDTTETAAAEAVEVENEATVDQSTADGGNEPIEGADALGDAGKKALDAMKAKWKEAERVAKERDAELAALKAAAEGREAEFKAEQEAQKVRDEALSAANKRVLRSELKAAAAGKLADPMDALKFLDLDSFEADDSGDFDTGAIASAIDGLLNDKPYLAAQGGRRFQGSADGGARKESGPTQVTRDELSRMSPDDINRAREEGRLNDVLGRH